MHATTPRVRDPRAMRRELAITARWLRELRAGAAARQPRLQLEVPRRSVA